jgi:hypothetical protein
MLSSEKIAEIRTTDYKFLGRFRGLADMVGVVSAEQVLTSLKEIKEEHDAEIKRLEHE